MDLLKTLMIYMSLVFTASVQNAPEPSYIPQEPTTVPAAYVQAATPSPTPSPKPTPVPTINITPNPAYKTVQVGDNGDLVRQLQEKLAEYGYYEGEIDGRFGNQTRRAVEKFQYQHGLSADGIAGRNTLTVLYESPEIRMAPQMQPTPTATPEMQLAAAITPEPTAEPTAEPSVEPVSSPAFVPVETVAVASTATPTAAPEATPVPEFLPMQGWVILVNGESEPVTTKGDGQNVLAPYSCADECYLPLKDVLTSGYLNVISSDSIELDEFAFAIGNDIFRFAYTENQTGEPANVEAFKNNEPQIMPLRDIRRVGETIYLPSSSIQNLTGIAVEVDETAKTVSVTIPAFEEE